MFFIHFLWGPPIVKHLQMNAAILGASTTQTQLQQHFGPGFEEIKQHLSSCHAYQRGASKVLPLLCSRGISACSFSLSLLLGVVVGSYIEPAWRTALCMFLSPGPGLWWLVFVDGWLGFTPPRAVTLISIGTLETFLGCFREIETV